MKTEAIYERLALLQLALANPGAQKEKKLPAIVHADDQSKGFGDGAANKVVPDPVNWDDTWFANYE